MQVLCQRSGPRRHPPKLTINHLLVRSVPQGRASGAVDVECSIYHYCAVLFTNTTIQYRYTSPAGRLPCRPAPRLTATYLCNPAGKCTRGDACPFLHPAHDSGGGSSVDGGTGTKADPIEIPENRGGVRPFYVSGGGAGIKAMRAADLGSWADVVGECDGSLSFTYTAGAESPSIG